MNILRVLPEFSPALVPNTPIMISSKIEGEWVDEAGFVIENQGDTLSIVRFTSIRPGYKVTNLRAKDYMRHQFKLKVLV